MRKNFNKKIFNEVTTQNHFNMAQCKHWITLQAVLTHSVLIIAISLLLIAITSGKEVNIHRQGKQFNNRLDVERSKRAPNGEDNKESSGEPLDNHEGDDNEKDSTSEPESDGKGDGKSEVSLGGILGICLLICTIIYCIGIGYKIFKIFKGTYVEEEPVFLKYK